MHGIAESNRNQLKVKSFVYAFIHFYTDRIQKTILILYIRAAHRGLKM